MVEIGSSDDLRSKLSRKSRHNYIEQATFEALDDVCDKIIAQIVKMIDQSEKWIIKVPSRHRRPRH